MTKPAVVVVGATGLIGSSLVEVLQDGYEVHCVSRHGRPGHPPSHTLDLTSAGTLDALPSRVDKIIYLAQSEFFREFPERSEEIFQVNTSGVLRLLDYARRSGASSFVYGSSGGVYGTAGITGASEGVQIPARGNLGFYLATKLCAEILLQTYAPYFNTVTLRYFFVYGPGQRQSMLIPRLIQRVRTGDPILLQGTDGIRLNPVFVSDAAVATSRALELRGNHIINVAGPETLAMRELGELIGRRVNRDPSFVVEPDATPDHLVGDTRRMRELLCTPGISMAHGLELMLEYEHRTGP